MWALVPSSGVRSLAADLLDSVLGSPDLAVGVA
jgi:hypothetical protein